MGGCFRRLFVFFISSLCIRIVASTDPEQSYTTDFSNPLHPLLEPRPIHSLIDYQLALNNRRKSFHASRMFAANDIRPDRQLDVHRHGYPSATYQRHARGSTHTMEKELDFTEPFNPLWEPRPIHPLLDSSTYSYALLENQHLPPSPPRFSHHLDQYHPHPHQYDPSLISSATLATRRHRRPVVGTRGPANVYRDPSPNGHHASEES